MASQAVIISEKRMNLYDLLNLILEDQKEQLPRIKFFAVSGIEEQLKNVPALTIEEEICKQLTENRKIDSLIGKTRYSAINSDFKIQNFEKIQMRKLLDRRTKSYFIIYFFLLLNVKETKH